MHLFIFYFSNFAGTTPPLALTAFAAAGIAKSNPFRTGFLAMVMALPTYIVAYPMVLRPELLMQGAWTDIVYTTASTALGAIMFALGSSGALIGKSSWPERVVSVMAGLMLIDERRSTDIARMGIIALLLSYHLLRRRDIAMSKV